jgi:hypothetical protein
MPLASSSLVQIAYAPETVFGVTPTTGSHTKLRFVGESLNYEIQKESSAEINSSRSTSSKVPVSASTSGDLQFEMSYKEYDPLIAAVLQSDFVVFGVNGVGATFIATFTATTITASVATTGASIFTALRPGQFFRLVAPGNGNNGKIFRVSLTVAPTATVITVDASTPLVTGTSIANCTIATSRLTNGSTQKSFSIERQSTDIGEYWCYSGQVPGTWEFSLGSGALTTHSISMTGRRAVRNTSTHLPGAAVESSAFDVHSSASGSVCLLWVDGAPLVGTFVQSLSFSYDNAIEAQTAACDIGAVGVRSGTIALTGSMSIYFANGDLFDKFATNTNISLTFSSVDSNGNGYVFTMPKVNISSLGGANASAKDQDMMVDIEFEALRDLGNANPLLRQVVFIDRVGVAV